jgi:TolA-binding protein
MMRYLVAGLLLAAMVGELIAADRPRRRRPRGERSATDFQANRLLKRAHDLLDAGEAERGVKMLQTVVAQYPESVVRYKAYLALGRHYGSAHQEADAIRALSRLGEIKKPDVDPRGEALEVYLEGLYLTGIAYYNTRQFTSAFPVLRKITRNYPNTVWANQAYYYIGMCHFRLENWNKAIEALSLVGTFVDADAATVDLVEAGKRYYLKIHDADLPIALRLGKQVKVTVRTGGGDAETITCVPLSRHAKSFIGSLPTAVRPAAPELKGNQTLEILGGDTITAVYHDEMTQSGEHRVAREMVTKVVSTGSARFTLGTYDGTAAAAFLGQPAFVVVKDADLDTGPQAERVQVRLICRYRKPEAEEESNVVSGGIDLDRLMAEETEEDEFLVRDELLLTLQETGEAPVRSGIFHGKVLLNRASSSVSMDDDRLSAAIGDELIVVYEDERHIFGTVPQTRESKLTVIGEIDGRPRATQNIVFDAAVKARKHLVEATAFLELGKIFRDMGLLDGASTKCDEGLEKVEVIIRAKHDIPTELRQRAYERKWELQMVKGDMVGAIGTCELFNRLYPDSPLVDAALKQVATVHMEQKEYREAIAVFSRIVDLKDSQLKAEASFRIAECIEKDADLSKAVPAYLRCATRFPDSPFAGEAIAKQVDYYYSTKDYGTANEQLTRVFEDYPDAPFLDRMLLKWVLVSYRMGDFQGARDKCQQLLFEYPASRYAPKAEKLLPQIEKRLARARKKAEEAAK